MFDYVLFRLRALLADRKGISSLEYAVMAVGIVGAVATAALALGGDISTALTGIGDYIKGQTIS